MKNKTWALSYCSSIISNLGLYFQTLNLTKPKVLHNLGLKSFVIWAIVTIIYKLWHQWLFQKYIIAQFRLWFITPLSLFNAFRMLLVETNMFLYFVYIYLSFSPFLSLFSISPSLSQIMWLYWKDNGHWNVYTNKFSGKFHGEQF